MGSILVISDNEILNQLYITNLEVYLHANVILVNSVANAFEELKKNKFDLLITTNQINEQDSAIFAYDYLLNNQLKTKLIIIGNLNKELGDVIIIPNSYNLQNLIRSCAQVLGVTAKAMAEKEVPQFYPIKNQFLSKIREVPCNVYMQINDGSYTLIAKKGDLIGSTIREFITEGVTTLFVNALDRLLITNIISTSIIEFLRETEELDSAQKSEALKLGFLFASFSFSDSAVITEEIMALANACTKAMEEISLEAPSLKNLLAILNWKKDGFLYTHSILASYVSNHIIRRVPWGGDSLIEKVNFVLFFHDIMLAPIYLKHPSLKYEEDLLFNDNLTDKEKETVLNHARLAAEAIITYKRAPIGADLLIKQHHGVVNGVGFTLEFKDDISPLSKIVLISEAFIEEFMKQRDLNSEYILDIKKMVIFLNEKFKRRTYQKIIETLENFPVL